MFKGRHHRLMGNHTPGHNHDSIAIYLAQDAGPMGSKAYHALGCLVRLLDAVYHKRLRIVGQTELVKHRTDPKRQSPLNVDMANLRLIINELRATQQPAKPGGPD